jgi:hypothetical protein
LRGKRPRRAALVSHFLFLLTMLVLHIMASIGVRELYAPFSRPTAAQALAHLAVAATEQVENGEPDDLLDT